MPFATRDGVQLYYEDSGAGPALLLHTGGGGDGRMWRLAGYCDGLPGYRLLVMDHRGHGRSSCPADPDAHSLDHYVADVLAVLDDAGVDRAAIVGYSFGARLAYAVGVAHPDRVSAIVGIGSAEGPDEDPAENAEFAAEVRQADMRTAMEQMAAAEPEPPPGWLIDNLANTDAEMFALLLEGLASAPTAWQQYPSIQAPILLVGGEREAGGNAPANAAQVAQAIPYCESVMLPGLAHLQVFWRTDLTLGPIRDFLRRTLPAAGGGAASRLDEQGRPEPPVAADETAMLLAYLDYHRATFAWKCRGLDSAGLNTRTAASTMTLGGIMKHLAVVEDGWFGRSLWGQGYSPPWDAVDWASDPDWEWRTAAEDRPEDLWALWEAAVARSRERVSEALAGGGLDQLAARTWPDGRAPSLRWILLHMIEEYARHNGHADLLREAIDGQTGE